jgi:hypothetical protein
LSRNSFSSRIGYCIFQTKHSLEAILEKSSSIRCGVKKTHPTSFRYFAAFAFSAAVPAVEDSSLLKIKNSQDFKHALLD